jgi:hypothetical protein
MKSLLRILARIALLPVAGCIFPPNRDYSYGPDRLRSENCEKNAPVVDPGKVSKPIAAVAV